MIPWRTRAFGWLAARGSVPVDRLTATEVAAARERRAAQVGSPWLGWLFGRDHPDVDVTHRVVDLDGVDVRLRVERPRGGAPDAPVVVVFHGGGWVMGSPEQISWLSTHVAAACGVVVVSVDYRLAPEHPWPAAVDDCWAATRWVHDHAEELGVDRDRMAVMGDSAGGNLAAVVALLARDTGAVRLRGQVLVYPAAELVEKYPSEIRNATAPVLTSVGMRAFSAVYLDGADPTVPLASPLRADDLSGLAPALVQTAEHDPLLDNGRVYARALAEAGVAVRQTTYRGAVHGFASLPGVSPCAEQALSEVCAEVTSWMG